MNSYGLPARAIIVCVILSWVISLSITSCFEDNDSREIDAVMRGTARLLEQQQQANIELMKKNQALAMKSSGNPDWIVFAVIVLGSLLIASAIVGVAVVYRIKSDQTQRPTNVMVIVSPEEVSRYLPPGTTGWVIDDRQKLVKTGDHRLLK